MESMSMLGQILYLNKPPPEARNETFTILIHKYGDLLEKKHVKKVGKRKLVFLN